MSLYQKLSAIQVELKAPKGHKNAHGGYMYRSCEDILDALKPLLSQHKCTLILSDSIEMVGTRFYVKVTAKLTDASDDDKVTAREAIECTALAREPEERKGFDASQITGAASSYARKYALNGLFCIDDTKDADSMDNRPEPPKVAKPAPVAAALPEQVAEIEALCTKLGKPYEQLKTHFKVSGTWTMAQATAALAALHKAEKDLAKQLDSQA